MKPEIAIIARVGAHKALAAAGLQPHHTEVYSTPYGDSRPVHWFRQGGIDFVVLSRHGEAGYEISAPFINARANLYALKAMGVSKILAWVAPGSLREEMAPGDAGGAPRRAGRRQGRTPYLLCRGGVGFHPAPPPVLPGIEGGDAGGAGGCSLRSAWPGGLRGYHRTAALETAAEIRKFGLLGGDLVGQTLAPEVFLARELEFCYTALTYVVNYAEGVLDRPYAPGVLFEGLATPAEIERVRAVEAAWPEIILGLLPALAATPRCCPCPRLMERYRLRGDIGGDWRTWVR